MQTIYELSNGHLAPPPLIMLIVASNIINKILST